MITINLLPWREKLREQNKQRFLVLMGSVVMVILVFWIGIYWSFSSKLTAQHQVNELLQQEIALLDKQIKKIDSLEEQKVNLINRMQIIQTLQVSRPLTVRVFDELVQILPDGIYLKKVQREKDELTIVGHAESNTTISQFMRNIEASDWLKDPVLNEIKNEDTATVPTSYFELNLEQAMPRKREAEN